MINPQSVMKLMGAKAQFEKAHPRFAAFVSDTIRTGVEEDSVIEITLTRPDGRVVSTNMKVRREDLELFEELKSIAK